MINCYRITSRFSLLEFDVSEINE